MSRLAYATAGESHGPGLVTLIEGLPAGLEVPVDLVDEMLRLRQGGYGRGGRQKIETDRIEILERTDRDELADRRRYGPNPALGTGLEVMEFVQAHTQDTHVVHAERPPDGVQETAHVI